MKRKYIFIIFFVLIIVLMAFIVSNRLPEGTFIKSSTSPNGKYKVNAYLFDGGATVDCAIRAEVVYLETGKSRNIYWQYHAYSAQMKWLFDDVVEINGMALNVLHDMYDYRRR